MIASFIAVAGGVSDASREARAAEAAENAVVAELPDLTAATDPLTACRQMFAPEVQWLTP